MSWDFFNFCFLILGTASSLGLAFYLIIDAFRRKWNLSHSEFASVIGTLLISLFGAAQLFSSHKLDVQNTVISHQKDEKIDSLENTVTKEEDTLRSLDVIINVHFFAKINDNDPPFSNQYVISMPEQTTFMDLFWMTLPTAPGIQPPSTDDIRLYGTRMYRFVKQGPGYYMFIVEASIRSGEQALGQPLEYLKEVRGGTVSIPFTNPIKLPDKSIQVESVQVLFALNNNKKVQRTYNFSMKVPVPLEPENMRYAMVNFGVQGSDFFEVAKGREWITEPVMVPAPKRPF